MSDKSGNHGESQDQASSPEDDELVDLLEALARIESVHEPMPRMFALLKEAKRREASLGEYRALFDAYVRSKKHRRWRLERLLQHAERWLRTLTIFKVLQYLGRLAILVAVVSFFIDLPGRRRQRNHEMWQWIQAAEGRVFDSERVQMLERLNEACFDLDGLEAESAHLKGVRLDGCSAIRFGRWSRTLFGYEGAALRGSDLRQAVLVRARLSRANLSSARLNGASLEEADLRGASLRGADLRDADLFRADLQNADLTGANLEGAELSRANLEGADLSRARLSTAQLVRANLRQASLEYADCTDANFAGADLRASRLYKAILAHAKLRKARLDIETTIDEADISEADFTDASLPGADFLGNASNWRSAKLSSRPSWSESSPSVALLLGDQQFFYEQVRRGAERAVKEVGARLSVRTVGIVGGGLADERMHVRSVIKEGVDAIVLVPQDEIDSLELIEEAFRDGVELVCYDQCDLDRRADRFFTASFESDQKELGRTTGHYFSIWLSQQPARALQGKIALLRACDFEGCFRRVEGLRAGLFKSGFTDVAYRVADASTAVEVAREMLIERQDVKILWSANEAGTLAAVKAVERANRVGEVVVFGTDISPELARMLLDEKHVLQAVTSQRPEKMGYDATHAALDAIYHGAPLYEKRIVEHQLYSRLDPDDRLMLERLLETVDKAAG